MWWGWMGLGLGKCLFVLSVIVLFKGFKLNKHFNFDFVFDLG